MPMAQALHNQRNKQRQGDQNNPQRQGQRQIAFAGFKRSGLAGAIRPQQSQTAVTRFADKAQLANQRIVVDAETEAVRTPAVCNCAYTASHCHCGNRGGRTPAVCGRACPD